jgi:hypothetical protein
MTRTAPPNLEFRAPECPVCDTETVHNGDGFECEGCCLNWHTDGTGGTADEDTPQCQSEAMPWVGNADYPALAHHRYRCIRDEGHPVDMLERHCGVRVDKADCEGWTFDWRDGQYPQPEPNGDAAASPGGVTTIQPTGGVL